MRAIIISAGIGSRLLPLTAAMPKCLVAVDGRAILDRQLDALAEAGVREAVVVGGYRADQLQAHLAHVPHCVATSFVLNPFWSVAGAVGSVWAARGWLAEPFVLMNGDTLFDARILLDAVRNPAKGVSLVVEPLAAPALDDMLVAVEDGRVRDVAKDLTRPTHRSLGIIVSGGGDAYARALTQVIGAEDGVHAYHHAVVARLAREGLVAASIAPPAAHWQEIDRPEDIAAWTGDHPA